MGSLATQFPKKKRIKVSYFRLCVAFGNIGYWQTKELIRGLESSYGMKLTSKRVGLLYFKILDPLKYSLFVLQYPETIINA